MRCLIMLVLLLGFCLGALGCAKGETSPTSMPPQHERLKKPGPHDGPGR
jgi:hypothetical protein